MTWTAYPCRWPDAAAYDAALAGVDLAGLDLLVTGIVRTPAVLAEDGETVLAPGDALPGWHVSVACRGRALPDGWPVMADPPVGMLRHALAAAVQAAPLSLSLRQFLTILLVDGHITEAEALAAARTGDVPGAIEAVLTTLPPAHASAARLAWAAMTVVERDNPLVALVGASRGLTAADLDDLWRRGALVV